MNCEKYKDYIMKHMDKTITETEQIELDEHLKRCSECRLEYDELKNIVSVLEERSCVEPPADFENMVMKKINVLDIYHKKQRKKRILIYGFAFIFAFMTVLLMFAALCRESILGLLLARCVGIAVLRCLWISYAYGFVPCLYGLCVRKRKDGVFRFLLSLNRPCCNCFDVKNA